MIECVLVPQAFENMEEATLGAWRKREGDSLTRDEPLCELITEKTTFDLPFEIDGDALTLLHIAAPEKSVLPVHAILALVGPASTSADDLQVAIEAAVRDNQAVLLKRSASPDETPVSIPALSVPSLSSPNASAGGTRVRATPAAKRAARDMGVEIEAVALSRPGKVLSEEDVRAFASA